MSRVEMVEPSQVPLLARRFFDGGDPGPIVASLAHVPELLEVTMPFIGTVLGPSSLVPRLKEIVILRTSSLLSCRYCINSHTVAALDSGLSRSEVLALRSESDVRTTFSDHRERALLAWIDCVAGEAGAVSEEVSDLLSSHFSDAETIEITLVAGTTMMLNRFCTALMLPSTPETMKRLSEEGLA
jgi:AhpD family alkylhydroperoxidase